MTAMTVDNRYLVSLRFHKKPRYKQVRRNELEIDEQQVWLLVEMKGKDIDEKLSSYLYESIETTFKYPKRQRFRKFNCLMQKIGLSLDSFDYIDEEVLTGCSYITYGIHPLNSLASNIQIISIKDLK